MVIEDTGTMVGHILVSYALLATQDGQVSTLPGGRIELLQSSLTACYATSRYDH